jgi:hypothetical protein
MPDGSEAGSRRQAAWFSVGSGNSHPLPRRQSAAIEPTPRQRMKVQKINSIGVDRKAEGSLSLQGDGYSPGLPLSQHTLL